MIESRRTLLPIISYHAAKSLSDAGLDDIRIPKVRGRRVSKCLGTMSALGKVSEHRTVRDAISESPSTHQFDVLAAERARDLLSLRLDHSIKG